MSIQFTCSQCQKKIGAPEGSEGKGARCPACSAITRIPAASEDKTAVPVAQIASPPGLPETARPAATGENPFAAPTTTDFSGAMEFEQTPGRYLPTWENRPSMRNFFKSTIEILFSPQVTFQHLKREGAMLNTLLFLAIGGVIFTMTGVVEELISMLMAGEEPRFVAFTFVFGALAACLIGPIIMFIVCSIFGLVIHLMLWVTGAAKYPVGATVRAVAYLQTAAWPFGLIPVIGQPIGGIWLLAIQIRGLAEVHETTRTRVLLALLVPFVVLVGIVVVVLAA